jgi:hypothetical protein
MKEYILKNPDGAFGLTQSGEQEVLLNTARKLVNHYLKQSLNKTPDEIKPEIKSLQEYIYKNIFSLNDYLARFTELSKLIRVNNIEQFQKFMGQYFLPTFHKEKSIFIDHQKELNKEKLDNPFWTPSCDLLKLYRIAFESSPELEWAKEDPENETEAIPVVEKTVVTIPVEEKIDLEPPGMKFLIRYEKLFLQAPALKTIETVSEQTEEDTEPIEDIKIPETPKVYKPEEMPGRVFLAKFALKFSQSPRLEITGEQISGQPQGIQKLFFIRSYASILGKISSFNKAKDMEAYKKWYLELKPRQKAVVKINSLLLAEKKGVEVNWGNEILNCSVALNENKNDLYALTSEIKLYSKIIQKIKYLLANQNPPLLPAEVSNIYSQSIIILNDENSMDEKKAAIKILLLQIPDENSRKILIKEFENFIKLLD